LYADCFKMLANNLLNSVKTKVTEFKNDPGKVKQALGATGAVVVFAGGLFGLKALLQNKPKPVIKHLSPALSHYLEYNEDWYYQVAALSDYGHFAQAAFEHLAEAATFLIYLTANLESQQNYSKLYNVAQLIGIIVESIRVMRAHVYSRYGSVQQVMLEFDEVAANIQTLCNDTQFNVDNILHYQKMTK
jgi:hypothetical protein